MIDLPISPPDEEPGPKHVTFIDTQGNAVSHFTAPTRAIITENTPPGFSVVDGHLPLNHAPSPSDAEKESNRAKMMIEILEKKQARAMREDQISRGFDKDGNALTQQQLRKQLEDIDDKIIQLRTKII